MNDIKNNYFNPDVLNCIANLSSDEVFTPPTIANAMLDLLPQEIWKDRNAKFLDPFTKSGVFLREITKRLLEAQMPNYLNSLQQIEDKKKDGKALSQKEHEFMNCLQENIDYILHNQVYGIAITELTSLLSRRSLYCSKYPNCKYSISKFDDAAGNIRFKRVEHTWKNGKCIFCGASQSEYDRDKNLETHAYEFIHVNEPKEIFNMKFDVIIGNPPYQMSTGGGQAQATPLYDKFVLNAIKLAPKYLVMITPSRWFAGGFPQIEKFRDEIIKDGRMRIIHDFEDASECFPGVEIKGGVSYFKWERDSKGDCTFFNHEKGSIVSSATRPLLETGSETIIRNNEAIKILHKVIAKKEKSFSEIVSPLWVHSIKSTFQTLHYEKKKNDDIFAYVMKDKGWIDNAELEKNRDLVGKWKLFLPRSVGSASVKTDRVIPILGKPNTCCSGTYIIAGTFNSEVEALNAKSYIDTKFFHFLLSLKKVSQDTVKGCYTFIPLQNFDEVWTDEKLYKKYDLSEEEIKYIEELAWSERRK